MALVVRGYLWELGEGNFGIWGNGEGGNLEKGKFGEPLVLEYIGGRWPPFGGLVIF